MMERLNTTGTFYKDENSDYWSYNTQLTCNYKNYRLVNITFYSITTRKHQLKIKTQNNDVEIINNHYGSIKPEQDLRYYLNELYSQINKLKSARESKHKQTKINNCQKQIDIIESIK